MFINSFPIWIKVVLSMKSIGLILLSHQEPLGSPKLITCMYPEAKQNWNTLTSLTWLASCSLNFFSSLNPHLQADPDNVIPCLIPLVDTFNHNCTTPVSFITNNCLNQFIFETEYDPEMGKEVLPHHNPLGGVRCFFGDVLLHPSGLCIHRFLQHLLLINSFHVKSNRGRPYLTKRIESVRFNKH